MRTTIFTHFFWAGPGGDSVICVPPHTHTHTHIHTHTHTHTHTQKPANACTDIHIWDETLTMACKPGWQNGTCTRLRCPCGLAAICRAEHTQLNAQSGRAMEKQLPPASLQLLHGSNSFCTETMCALIAILSIWTAPRFAVLNPKPPELQYWAAATTCHLGFKSYCNNSGGMSPLCSDFHLSKSRDLGSRGRLQTYPLNFNIIKL
jgi:hypothetical protein